MNRLSAAVALSALTGLVSPPDYHPGQFDGYQPPRPKEPVTGECKCGRRISHSASQCATCAGVTDSPTARRMARALDREKRRREAVEIERKVDSIMAERRRQVGLIVSRAVAERGGGVIPLEEFIGNVGLSGPSVRTAPCDAVDVAGLDFLDERNE